jgi:hypothetical protein
VTSRILVAVVLVVAAGGVAWVLERRRRGAPPPFGRSLVPAQVDRADFPRPDAPWLVLAWTSSACASCRDLGPKLAPLESPEVAVAEIGFPERRDLHERYRIEAAPVTMVVDAQGVTRASFTGAFAAADLWAAVAELRGTG